MAERPEACPAWQIDLAGWLVAQLDPDREARLRAHLSSCVTCRDEAESLIAVAAVSLAADAVLQADDDSTQGHRLDHGELPLDVLAEPSDGLGERILEAVHAERRARQVARSTVVALATAAAMVVAVIVLTRSGDPAPVRGVEVAFTVVPPGATAAAVVAADDHQGSLVQLTASGLDPDLTYALWLSPPDGTWDDRVAAGTFRPGAHGEVDVRLRCSLPPDRYGRVWATAPDGTIALDTR